MSTPPEMTLRQIADWQLSHPRANALRGELSQLQRGLVWEPCKTFWLSSIPQNAIFSAHSNPQRRKLAELLPQSPTMLASR